MAKPIPKPHRLRVWKIWSVPNEDGSQAIVLWHTSEHPSKGDADRVRREMRDMLGPHFSSASVEPL